MIKLYGWEPLSTTLAGRPNIGWEYDITQDSILIKINNWAKCSKDRNK